MSSPRSLISAMRLNEISQMHRRTLANLLLFQQRFLRQQQAKRQESRRPRSGLRAGLDCVTPSTALVCYL